MDKMWQKLAASSNSISGRDAWYTYESDHWLLWFEPFICIISKHPIIQQVESTSNIIWMSLWLYYYHIWDTSLLTSMARFWTKENVWCTFLVRRQLKWIIKELEINDGCDIKRDTDKLKVCTENVLTHFRDRNNSCKKLLWEMVQPEHIFKTADLSHR